MRGALKLSKKAVYSCAESISCMRARKAGWRGVVIVIMYEALSEKNIYSGDEYDGKGDAVGKISMLVRFRGLSNSKSAKIC